MPLTAPSAAHTCPLRGPQAALLRTWADASRCRSALGPTLALLATQDAPETWGPRESPVLELGEDGGGGKKRQGDLGFCERPPEVLLVLLTITCVYVRTTPTDDRPAELTLTGTLGSHQGPWPSFMADTHSWV